MKENNKSTKHNTNKEIQKLIFLLKSQEKHIVKSSETNICNSIDNNDFLPNKMLSDRLLLESFNVIENNNKQKNFCDNNISLLYFDKSSSGTTPSNSISALHNNENQMELDELNVNNNCNNSNSTTNLTNSNCVKRERLSPSTNGDLPSISRSRSETPLSFRGTPPHSLPTTDLTSIQNLSSNLLSMQQPNRNSSSGDLTSRNYSNFMRSLAAKYNNCGSNEQAKRNNFVESTNKAVINNRISNSKKESVQVPSSPEPVQPNVQNISTTSPNVSPLVTTLLSSLQFSPSVFPSLIDMNSTQALLTLSRAAKETEFQNALKSSQKRRLSRSFSTSPKPSNMSSALQQAAQFASPSLMYSAQLQHHQLQQTKLSQSSPLTNITKEEKNCTVTSPLDLSSAPTPSKRLKSDLSTSMSTSSNGSTLPKCSPLSTAAFVPQATRIPCSAQSEEINSWSINDVFNFVEGIDLCKVYAENFREQCIDGSGLPLLTEDHLTNSLKMKLGPALKFRRILSNKLGGPCPCVSCMQQIITTQSTSGSNIATTLCHVNNRDIGNEHISIKDNLGISCSSSPSASADSAS
ncbi:SAMD11 family protein [Megaselia abdita]